MSPAAQRLLALLADGYFAEFEDLGEYDGRDAKLRKTMKFDGDLHAATMELRDAGLVGISANGSGTAWINDKGRAALPELNGVLPHNLNPAAPAPMPTTDAKAPPMDTRSAAAGPHSAPLPPFLPELRRKWAEDARTEGSICMGCDGCGWCEGSPVWVCTDCKGTGLVDTPKSVPSQGNLMARGDGATTRQMQAAPNGAFFVWVNGYLHYPKALARKLGREDLRIVAPSALPYCLYGMRLPVVVDHAAALTDEQALAVQHHSAVLVERTDK